ncbi:cilia- and flagella-associated protein HOATZ isoform X2 [Sceloporus undulatus]|uniref:cilia- and flagella-associated protein HOATZ isoform X2 n=1 Tax=Sceloporus undulatus TaxID=8520 RepID=UPI001C4A9176|nr:cilia- and flagella-associated protein HOATZ isoform X2 [Sceloporus undulatus]
METRPGQGSPLAPLAPRPPTPASLAASTAASGVPLVFAGSSEKDVALAKTFWNSVTLQPPLESRLSPRRYSILSCGSSSGSRRGSTANTPRKNDISARPSLNKREEEKIQEATEAERSDLKEQYLKKAKKREDILSLLKKQREERIRESLSHQNRTRTNSQESEEQLSASDHEDRESVKALN